MSLLCSADLPARPPHSPGTVVWQQGRFSWRLIVLKSSYGFHKGEGEQATSYVWIAELLYVPCCPLLCHPRWSPLSLSCLTCHSTTLRVPPPHPHTQLAKDVNSPSGWPLAALGAVRLVSEFSSNLWPEVKNYLFWALLKSVDTPHIGHQRELWS